MGIGQECHHDEQCFGGSCEPATSTCQAVVCGDGIIGKGEACDDGNTDTDDECIECNNSFCGDGFLHKTNETCDDGALNSDKYQRTSHCNATCTGLAPYCGDNNTNGPEECDDGDNIDDELCDFDCTLPQCLDGHLNVSFGESCDDGIQTARCNHDCSPQKCGDLKLNTAAGEQCDDGDQVDDSICDFDCSFRECGDKYTNTVSGEECDDGNESNTDNCIECQNARCGDGYLHWSTETCDDGDDLNADDWAPSIREAHCDKVCSGMAPHCGDGLVNGKEECDDGDNLNDKLCDFNCTFSKCGDGDINTAAGEECDDGNTLDDERCDFDCSLRECGDNYTNTEAGEECDDGNNNLNDNCPSGDAGTCQPAFCGDGYIYNQEQGQELCDEGSLNGTIHSADVSCSSVCTPYVTVGDLTFSWSDDRTATNQILDAAELQLTPLMGGEFQRTVDFLKRKDIRIIVKGNLSIRGAPSARIPILSQIAKVTGYLETGVYQNAMLFIPRHNAMEEDKLCELDLSNLRYVGAWLKLGGNQNVWESGINGIASVTYDFKNPNLKVVYLNKLEQVVADLNAGKMAALKRFQLSSTLGDSELQACSIDFQIRPYCISGLGESVAVANNPDERSNCDKEPLDGHNRLDACPEILPSLFGPERTNIDDLCP
ncbi:MAG: hypothetical protein VYA34_00975 [Myxococcota bacterium]|nr:hypothetical protein [Myxococcota bacterium]